MDKLQVESVDWSYTFIQLLPISVHKFAKQTPGRFDFSLAGLHIIAILSGKYWGLWIRKVLR